MKPGTFDRIGMAVIALSAGYTIFVALTSWHWFPTPGEWGDIARIPKSVKNYLALLLPPCTILAYLVIRRKCFGHTDGRREAGE